MKATFPNFLLAGCTLAAVLFSSMAMAREPRGMAVLMQRMQAAQAALAQAGGDPSLGNPARTAALAQMEAVLIDCGALRGCALQPMLDIYKRSLAAGVPDADADPDADDEIISADDMVDVAADPRTGVTTAGTLLDERNKRFVQMVQFNPAVQAGIRRWLTDMRPALMSSYENYQVLRYQMAPAFQNHGLPEALLFGILSKESNGKVHVGSRAGAVGPLQFMPDTGRRFGLGMDGTGFDTRYDPRASSEAAASYLQERLAELNNSIELSLAAYNGGEGRALRAFQAGGGRTFWDASMYDQFPAETRDYVPMVIAAAWLYLHPRDYGVRFPHVSNRAAPLRLQRTTTLYELTICMGNPRGSDGYLRALRNLNPRYQPDSWVPAGATLNATTAMVRAYDRYCVNGKRADMARQIIASDPASAVVRVGALIPVGASASPTPMGQMPVHTTIATGRPAMFAKPSTKTGKSKRPTEHVVRRGDNLVAIAVRYQCDTRELAKANGIKPPRYDIRPGQRLKLRGCGD